MCKKPKFYICRHCGNIFGVVEDSGVTPVCCGDPMEVLTPNTVDVYKRQPCVIGTSVGALNAAVIAQNDFDKALNFW